MGYKAMGPGEIILGDIKKKGKKKNTQCIALGHFNVYMKEEF